jgi:hypothetical protein
MIKPVLHIYPTYGDWIDTDMVEVVDKLPQLSVSLAVEAGRLSVFTRDHVFAMIAHPSMQQRYEDIIYHPGPRTTQYCFHCRDDRHGMDACDTCLQAFTPPF